MAAVTIIVEFEALDGKASEFERIMLDHARRTLNEEPGCERFDVIRPIDDAGLPKKNFLIVNELYSGPDAVIAHRANPRMAPLGETIAPLLKSRRLIEAVSVVPNVPEEGKRPEDLNAANDD